MTLLTETPWRASDLDNTLDALDVAHGQINAALDKINAAHSRLKRIPGIDRDRLASYTDAALMVTSLLQAEIAATTAPLAGAVEARREVMEQP